MDVSTRLNYKPFRKELVRFIAQAVDTQFKRALPQIVFHLFVLNIPPEMLIKLAKTISITSGIVITISKVH